MLEFGVVDGCCLTDCRRCWHLMLMVIVWQTAGDAGV